MKICSCGKHYSEEEWTALPKLGEPQIIDGERFVYANCPACRTTMARGNCVYCAEEDPDFEHTCISIKGHQFQLGEPRLGREISITAPDDVAVSVSGFPVDIPPGESRVFRALIEVPGKCVKWYMFDRTRS